MFIATKIWFDPETFVAVAWDGYEYEGSLDLCDKKGRGSQQQNTKFQQGQAGTNAANEASSYGKAQGLLGEDIGSTAPGSLSPAAQAQLASDNDNISRTYNGMRQQAFASMGQTGGGSAPSGFSQTTQNALNNGEAGQQTGAYRNAQINTQNQRNTALQGETALSGQQLQGELGNTGAATTSAYDQSKMGSTLGDIVGGASQLVGAATGLGGLFGGIGANVGGGGSPATDLGLGQSSTANALLSSGALGAIPGVQTYKPGAPAGSSVGGY